MPKRRHCGILSRIFQPFRALCLPVLSMTRTPGGRHMEWSSAFFEPVFEVCERGVWFLGLLCFLLVLLGITTVVFTFYIFVLPFLWHVQHPLIFAIYILYGHYLLISICFHYFMGVCTDPGRAPKVPGLDLDQTELKRGWKVCHKCEALKPPRAHHCRICNRCVLKMDHHCPWMFNCVGHYNHRYFMLFVVFMWMGTFYVVHCAWSRVFVLLRIDSDFVYNIIESVGLRESIVAAERVADPSHVEGTLLVITFFVCVGVTIALTILGGWQVILISRSETTIEFYTNKRDARALKKEGKVFVNPYYYGLLRNWAVFLGLVNGRSFLWHVLLPSCHKPHHDGLDWNKEDVLCYKDKLRTIPV